MNDDIESLSQDFECVFLGPLETGVFRLLDLPPEIWIRICEFAVTRSSAIIPTKARRKYEQQGIVRQPPITQVCRLIRHESLPLFYRKNDFVAFHRGPNACVRYWLQALPRPNLKAMGQLLFHTRFPPVFWTEKFEEAGLNVKVEMADGRKDEVCVVRSCEPLMITFV